MGGHLLRLLASERDVTHLTAAVRREGITFGNAPRARACVVDFADLEAHAAALAADQVFISLGTTMRTAGSRAAFRKVDLDAVVSAARVTAATGARALFLVSSVGADPGSRSFYLRVKGEAEAAVATVGFRAVHVARPSMLTGSRRESRPAERLGIAMGSLLAPFMVGPARRFRPIAGEAVARALTVLARDPGTGVHIHESDQLARVAAVG